MSNNKTDIKDVFWAFGIIFMACGKTLKPFAQICVIIPLLTYGLGLGTAYLCGALTTHKTKTTEKYNKVMMRTVLRQQEELTCYKRKDKNCGKKFPKKED